MILNRMFYAIWNYAKRHTFHFIFAAILAMLVVAQFSQYTLMWATYTYAKSNTTALTEYKSDVIETLQGEREVVFEAIEEQGREFVKQLEHSEMEVNSRIDILDSAIKPDEKRKMLVVKIRNAITDNTKTKLTIRKLNNIANATIDYSYQYNLSIAKVLAQMKTESNFNPEAISKAGAQGLMQIMPKTLIYEQLKEGKRLDPWNIYHNIKAGCSYMSEQVTDFTNYNHALQSYNWGPNNIRKYLAGEYTDDDMPAETKKYPISINKWTKVFEKYGLE